MEGIVMTEQPRGPEAIRPLTVRREDRAGLVVVSIDGELDASTVGHAGDQVRAATTKAPAVVVDMTQLRFFASAGLTLLVQLRHELTDRGAELRLVANQRAVLRPLQLMGVADDFMIYSSVDDAVESVRL
jgi:anti-anti-sigma factor